MRDRNPQTQEAHAGLKKRPISIHIVVKLQNPKDEKDEKERQETDHLQRNDITNDWHLSNK